MQEVTQSDSATRARYLAAIKSDRMVGALRTTASFVVLVNTLFLGLDLASHPESFSVLLAVRMAWNAAMVAIYCLAAHVDPLRMLQAGVIVSGIALIALIAAAGGLSSDYWPGMMILFVGIPVFLPVSGRQAAVLSGVLLLAFSAMPLISGEVLATREYVAPVFFVGAAALECVASSALLDRLRFGEFCQRLEIEAARDHLKEMDEVKARFTANIHHELRTPLTLTLAPLESLLAGEFGELAEKQRFYLQTMHANALRLLKLINNLLDLAKVESGKLRIRRRTVNVCQIVHSLVDGAKPLAEKKGVRLDCQSPSSVAISVDPEALEKVLMNLLGNALKFTPADGSIDVVVSATRAGGAAIAVRDTGVGLKPADADRVFDRFAQVDSSATRRHEGTGIGLALARELISLHGGRIWAESEGLGRGATIRVVLPRGGEDIETIADSANESESESQHREARYVDLVRHVDRTSAHTEWEVRPPIAGRRTVLVCEDNCDMRRLLHDVLSREFNVVVAPNGKEGHRQVLEQWPDVVVTDVMMPEMSGIELCEKLKADPKTVGIPVVLVTSKAEREMKISGLEKGADDYVTKPFHSRELLARVKSFVRLRQLQESLEEQNVALEKANHDLGDAMRALKSTESQLVHAERLSAVGELAAGVAHEINNPVNFAGTAARTILESLSELRRLVTKHEEGGGFRSELEECLETIEELAAIVREGLDRTGRLVGDLRDFAAPWRGADDSIDIGHALGSAVQLLTYLYQGAGVSLHLAIADDLPAVQGDPRAVGQVFVNLLKNAAEAFDRDGGSVWVGASARDGGVAIEVRDDGPGMNDETRGQVFEPFFSTKESGRGTGLGLAISRQVVDQHGGTISVDSALGRGTTFTVWLPGETRNGK